MNRSHLQHAASWLADIDNLTAGKEPLADAKTKLAGMAMALAEEFPIEALTRQSAIYVARQVTFFPSFGELAKHLSAWWRDHRPPPSLKAIERERDKGKQPDDREEETRVFWANITAAELRERVAWIEPQAGTVRYREPDERSNDARSIEAVARDMLARATYRGLQQHNPKLLGMLPPNWLPAAAVVVEPPTPPAEPPPRPKAYHLTREQILAAREQLKPANANGRNDARAERL